MIMIVYGNALLAGPPPFMPRPSLEIRKLEEHNDL